MREILFRGKREDNGKWIFGNHLYDDILGKHYIIPFGNINESNKVGQGGCCYCIEFEVVPETVGQYTVLPDKNGKKIFEGDIVAHFINWYGKRFNGSVRYESKIACWVCDFVVDNKTESAYLADWAHGNRAEVIGNIHDNPELLKEEVDE